MNSTKENLCYLCTGNSCRSVMAEYITKKYYNDKYNVYSAGSKPAEHVNYEAVEILKEIDIDASKHIPHTLHYWQKEQNIEFRYIITVCGDAHDRYV